ncbi:Transcription elongation factor, TFIIS/CRSP70, N-terminal, sub-type [Penicillium digitatum]|uniref:SnoaL-like domain-containing protein n=3 Tax=Penicillium digitatum TaxID=36651 RepID=K9GCY4_PEND2|nr:hypothetical protein PDIP_10060 [Penicillium digitatum Pd1]EKV19042.1 hypothetical protein PDIG_05390 [Penicillium digitatum PHI26]EKV21052.1 hypothetical protein PDIP_10060 [Penicillium digitatum Pd1]QQK48281.1 Transcription elongation factor, TFIIS/CRSP70, N-terminal, sub-type [Penicillium digitatum]
MTTRPDLLNPIYALLKALANPSPTSPKDLLSTFTTLPKPLVHEHGLPQLVPFLGRPFTGQDGIETYFKLISTLLSIKNMVFEPEENWVVDASCMAVSLCGSATFVWKETQQAWDETFVYRIKLTVDSGSAEGRLAVCEYQVWADTGAAYLARLGRLGNLSGSQGSGDGLEGI